jgi:hypothetical protein
MQAAWRPRAHRNFLPEKAEGPAPARPLLLPPAGVGGWSPSSQPAGCLRQAHGVIWMARCRRPRRPGSGGILVVPLYTCLAQDLVARAVATALCTILPATVRAACLDEAEQQGVAALIRRVHSASRAACTRTMRLAAAGRALGQTARSRGPLRIGRRCPLSYGADYSSPVDMAGQTVASIPCECLLDRWPPVLRAAHRPKLSAARAAPHPCIEFPTARGCCAAAARGSS